MPICRPRWRVVFLESAPGVCLARASCLLARFGGQRSTASATENVGKNAPEKFLILPFSPKFTQKICAKIIPQSPLKGDVGNGFRGVDGGKIRGYHSGQAKAERPRPSEPAQAVQEGGRA